MPGHSRKCSAVAASCRKSKVKSEKEQELELGREILSSRIKRKMRQLDTGEDTSQYPACEKAWFNYLYIFIIICHLIFIGYDTDRMGAALKSGEYTSSNKLEQGGDGLVCWIIEGVFITLFFIEAYIKIKTNGFEYFDSLNNQMDFSLVTLGLVLRSRWTPASNSLLRQNLIGLSNCKPEPKTTGEKRISNPHTFLEIAFRISFLPLGLA